MRKRRSLGIKLTAVFAVLGLGPLALMSVLALVLITATHRQNVAARELQLLRQKVEEIDKFFTETVGLFEIHVGYEETSIISDADQTFLLEKLLEENESIAEATFIDLLGQERSKRSRLNDINLIELADVRALPKFQVAKGGRQYVGPIYYALTSPMVTVASPVFNRLKQVIMVLTGEVALSRLEEIVASARLGDKGYLYGLDQAGTIFASPAKEFLYKNLSASAWIKEVLSGIPHNGLEASDARPGLTESEVLAAGVPLPFVNGALVAEWPRQDAFSIITVIKRQAIAFSLATVAVVALLGWLVGRRILRPLALLQHGAREIGSGNFAYKIALTTGDEIEELGEVFNRMGEDLARLEELKAVEIRAEALAESLRKEQEISHMKDEFIRNTSHQLRTPLAILNWGIDLTESAKSPEERQESLAGVKGGIEQLNAIVHDLLRVAEFGPSFKNTIYRDVNWPEVIGQVLSRREELLKKKQIVLEKDIAPEAAVVSANPVAMELVLENLIDNALTYTPVNGRVRVNAKRVGERIELSISDSGIGIPEKDQPLIFGQFFRAENAIEMKNVGTGLGLYLVKNIVEGHGGKVWFKSQVGEGTTFYVSLPIESGM